MLLNFAFCIVGCTVLAVMNAVTFLFGLGGDMRSMTGGVPFWLLLLGAAVLPLLACVCCFYASLSLGGTPIRFAKQPVVEGPPIEPKEVVFVEKPRIAELVGR